MPMRRFTSIQHHIQQRARPALQSSSLLVKLLMCWTALPGAPCQSQPLNLPPLRCSTTLNPERSSFLSERPIFQWILYEGQGFIWRSGLVLQLSPATNHHDFTGGHEEPLSLKCYEIQKKCVTQPLSLVDTGEKNLILEQKTWKGAKSGKLFLKRRKVTNSIFRTFEFSQTVL